MTMHREAPKLTPPVGAQDHVQGPADAPVTLVEYGDFECPYCGQADHVVKVLQRHLGDKLCYVFRQFPLADEHPHAQRAAEAAEAAAAQGKFWEMHAQLFGHQRALDEGHLAEYAREIGLDMPRFEHEMLVYTYAARVQADIESGERSGVTGTPGFFINGVRYTREYDQHSLLAALEEAGGLA